MDLSDENKNNHPASHKPTILNQGGVAGMKGGRKFGVEINHNRRGRAQPYPSLVDKRSLSQCSNFNADHVHRPITRGRRRFADEIANMKNCFPEEVKELKRSAEKFRVWEDFTLTDVIEDNKQDPPEPMILETTESTQDRSRQMKDVEMEDIFEEPVVDIDACDANDPLALVEYVDDLYGYYKELESSCIVSPDYMTRQTEITKKMRAILIDWLIEVHHKFGLKHEALFLTVNLIDRFLAKQGVARKKLQLVGLAALLLACKYQEITPPLIGDLIIISDNAYQRKELLEMEKVMLNTLEFNISVPTLHVFMMRFLKAAESHSRLEQLSFFLVELCLLEYEMLIYPPSLLASAAIYTAQCSLYCIKQWSKTCELYTTYREDQLLECSRKIVRFHEKAATGRLTGVHRKYNTSMRNFVAKCEPAMFLLKEEAMIIE